MELNELLEQIDRLKAEIDALRPIDSNQERRILQKFRLDWTFHSNSIEGNMLTYGETKAFLLHGITAQGKPFRDYLDIRGHHQAIDYLLELVRRQKLLTEADVRELHKVILVEPYDVDAKTPDGYLTKRRIQPGQYKTAPNHVETSAGEIHYYATPEETPAKMSDLMSWYRGELEEGKRHPLILAATFHYQFVAIHPFDDGNGRMARLLMNLFLMQAGFPPVIIHTEDKNNYLLALEQADTGDLEPFITHIGTELLSSLDLFLRGAKGENIEEVGDLDKKLTLLQRKLEHKDRQEDEIITLKKVYRKFIEPTISSLLVQLTKFDGLFESKDFVWAYYDRNKLINLQNVDTMTASEKFAEVLNLNVPEFQFEYSWRGLKSRDSIDLKFTFTLSVNTVGMVNIFYFLGGISDKKHIGVDERYEVKYDNEDFGDLKKTIPEKIYQAINKFVS